jgi:CTP:molybdopterin cytidylyltransferase MocA
VSGVAAIVLAAGASRRLGEPKQLVVLAGERLLERAVRVARAAGCEPVIAVLGAEAERIGATCDLGTAQLLVNEGWSEGMAASLRAGLAALDSACAAAVVMTCDQPAVSVEHLERLIEASAGSVVVASQYGGRKGVPACFPRTSFAELMQLTGDFGARRLLAAAKAVELPGGELDVDSADSLRTARALYEPDPGA